VNFAASTLTVEGRFDAAAVVREAAEHDGVIARPEGVGGSLPDRVEGLFWTQRRNAIRTAISGVALLAGWIAEWAGAPPAASVACFAAAMVVGGYAVIRRGLRALPRLQFDMNVMMTGAVIGAAAIGQWEEGAAVAFLYAVSNLLEASTVERARRSLRALMDVAPREARIRRNGTEAVIPPEQVRVGDVLLVRPGEKIAADGVVRAGASAVNQAPITGESVPAEKGAGDPVYAGTLNGYGALEVEVTRRVEDTTLAHIIHLVEDAQAQRAPTQQFVDRFARWYTPAVLALALGLAVVPPLLFDWPWGPWIYRGLALLVVSCPCALIVSTPVSIVSAIANAARRGVLIKGGAYLEELGRLRAVALDKTGTVTKGRMVVTDVLPLGGGASDADQLLALAAAVEARSEHPLAQAIVGAARRQKLSVPEVREFTALPGLGARADVDGQTIYVGSARFFEMLGRPREACAGASAEGAAGRQAAELAAQGKTAMLVGSGDETLGVIALADGLRPQARAAVAGMRAAGISHIALLTGDNPATARAMAEAIGADEARAELLPEQKVAAVRELRARLGSVAMVGDGVNDAPALAAASVGVAMGVAGSDVALETADVALMADDLERLPFLIRLGRAALGVIRQNIAFSLAIKAVAIAAVFPGWLTLWLAVLGDMGASVLVTINGMRLLAIRPTPHSSQS
jgi:Cd2+/Zn2+-exporting ATPase